MSKKRVLIIYTTAGIGHKKAAYAVKNALDEMNSGAEVDIIDSLDYTTPFFKWTYPRIYIFLVNRIPYIWGFGYYLLDSKLFYPLVCWVRHLTNWVHCRRLAAYLAEKRYDVIVATHFLPPDVISMEGKKRIPSFLINVVTDFRSHSFWIANGVDIYTVAHEETKDDLMSKYAIPADRIKVLGIPIDPLFSRHKDKDELRRKLGIDGSLFTVLLGSGGFGVGPVEDLVKSFKGISIPAEFIVICGKNETLYASIKKMKDELGIPVKPYGYVDNMDEFMEVADIIVTKTGGMMSSESLAKGLPIISIAPIPGQESRNSRILVRSGVALEAKSVQEVPALVKRLYEDRELRANIAGMVEAVKKPRAAYDIARLVIDSLK